MSPITRLRGSMSTTSSPVKQNGVLSNSSPSTPSSSPRALPGRLITRKSVPRADSEPNWKRASTTLNTRDELLMSLLASEAVIDSRDFDILSSEEVEELKKEHQVLQSRLVALTKKLSLESKIRDAARSLVRVNASNKKVSKQSEEQLDAATRRVEAVQADLWRVSERAHDVHKRLMEHRAGVLSLSVRSMEKKLAPRPKSGDSGYDSPSRHETPLLSPSMSIASGFSSQSRFDGAHFFAGHADAILPKRTFSAGAATTEIASLEERLKAATDALTAAGKKQAELSRELSMLRLEKQEVETTMTLELQSATETISALEEELPRLEKMDSEIQQLQQEKSKWEQDRPILEERARQADELQVRLAGMESRDGETAAIQKILGDERERSRRELEDKETEIQRLKETWAEEREQWEGQKALWEDEKMEDLARLQDEMERLREEDLQALQRAHQELDEGLSVLQALIQSHGIVLFSRESTMLGLAEAISSHLHNVHMRLEGCLKAEEEWSTMRRKMEEDIRSGLDKRESLQSELGEARRERDAVTLELNRAISRLEDQVKIESPALTTANLPPIDINIPTDTDVGKVTSLLLPLWAILPSPEARVAKFGASQRPFRTGSPVVTTNTMSAPPKSIADLDVRSLKTLYDSTRNVPGSPHVGTGGTFTFEAFATRVQALIQDDRALIERLIRFAQAHELLRKNAERAQKLAQEGANSLETYQKQVKTLEERNTTLSSRILALQEDIQVLQDNIERITAERLELEANAAEQAETCLQLTEANNALSARTLILAEEAASAPEMIRKQLEAQLAECRNALNTAQTEADEMRMSEQTQRIALMDELNSVQTENSRLRDQLRAVKK
ncbi:hypothetical protein AMATHDRAFT_59425 [Amanita thiersii Skay4041]|uniref:Up-regulated during septation protein 1 domain-containing protein n=1 Tax=Amanita thiersii Skay4041 TaxID=703135 RepID=A0A2A9NMM4_9AGAR|nr:hypothetical protein AMATHDRAFT_59425 [Amanita thiersii Skay4041]